MKKVFKVVAVLLFVLLMASVVFAADKTVVKVAFIAPFTGGNAQQGINGRNGFEMAINEVNKCGEFPYKIEFLALDDNSNPEAGVSAAQKACSDSKVIACAGHFNSSVAMATVPVFHENGVPMIIWSAISPDITEKYGAKWDEITRICTTLVSETNAFLDWIIDDLGYTNFSVISDTTSYGKSCLNYFKAGAEKKNITISSVDEINVGETDFMAILTKISGLKPRPQALYYGGVVMEGALIRQQMIKAGLGDMLFCACSGLDSERYNQIAGKKAEGTVIIGKGRTEKGKEWNKFVEMYNSAGYKEAISARTAYGYDAANIILQALNEVGPDREKMVKAIRNIKYNGIVGLYTFDEKGQTNLVAASKLVSQDGKWVVFDNSEYKEGKRKLAGK